MQTDEVYKAQMDTIMQDQVKLEYAKMKKTESDRIEKLKSEAEKKNSGYLCEGHAGRNKLPAGEKN